MDTTVQGYPLWAAWESQWGPVVGWRADESGTRWWPIVAPVGDADEAAAVEVRYARLFATAREAQERAAATTAMCRAVDEELRAELDREAISSST